MDKIQMFKYQSKEVRTVDKDGEVWFVAKDVCDILEIPNVSMAVQRLPEDSKGVSTIDTLGGKQAVCTVTEAGVYRLVFTSRKPEAEKFTDWVTKDVIPSIRKTGSYTYGQSIPKTFAEALRLAADTQEALEAKTLQLQEAQPKIDYADAVNASTTNITVANFAKLLASNLGIETGQNRLFKWLRENRYCYWDCEKQNLPNQTAVESGYLTSKQELIRGGILVNVVLITPKGQKYFAEKLRSEKLKGNILLSA